MSPEGAALLAVLRQERSMVERAAYGELRALRPEKQAALSRYNEIVSQVDTLPHCEVEALTIEAHEIKAYAQETLTLIADQLVRAGGAAC